MIKELLEAIADKHGHKVDIDVLYNYGVSHSHLTELISKFALREGRTGVFYV